MSVKKYILRFKIRRLAVTSLIIVLVCSLGYKSRLFRRHRKNVCEKFCELSDELYSLIRSTSNKRIVHGYKRVASNSRCLYESIPKVRSPTLSIEAEAFAEKVRKEKGSSYIDFQMPDDAWRTVDFGFVSFPSEMDCARKNNKTAIYLSSMFPINGFRPKLIEYLSYKGKRRIP